MALVFHSGFETGDLGEWLAATGSPSVVETQKKTGDYAMKCDTDATTAYVHSQISGDIQRATVYLYIDTAPDVDVKIIGYNTVNTYALVLTADSELDLYTLNTKRKDGSTQLSPNTWYRISISTTTGGECKYYINGVQESTTYTNVSYTKIDDKAGVIANATTVLYFDDIAFDQTSSSDDLGDIRVAAASPNLEGTYAQYDTSSGFGNVDEIPANDADFIRDNGGDVARESYNIPNLADLAGASSGDTVNAVSIWIRGDRNGGGATDHKAMVRDNGLDYESADLDFDSIAWFNWYLAIMPDDSAAWSEARFNSLEIGAYHSGGQDQRVHCLVAMVAYTPAVAPPVAIPRYGFVNFQDPGIV